MGMDGARPPETTPGSSSAREPLAVLELPAPILPEVPFRGLDVVLERLRDLVSGVFWLVGEEGSGRTTLLGRAIERLTEERRPAGVIRIECWPGLRFEEVLFTLADFLRHAGVPDLRDILAQRTGIAGKVRVLCDILHRVPVWIWLDDFENLDGSCGKGCRSVLEHFVATWDALAGGAGALVLVSRGVGPGGLEPRETSAETLEIAPAEIVDLAELGRAWTTAEGRRDAPPCPDPAAIHPALRTPLALGLLVKAAAETAAGDVPLPVDAASSAPGFAELVGALRGSLGLDARLALDLLALHRRPMSAGGLRALAGGWNLPDLGTRGVERLERLGLLARSGEDGRRLALHPTVRDAVEWRIRKGDPAVRRRMHRSIASRLLAAASRSRSIWDFHDAYVHLAEAGSHREAYETQKLFAEELLACGFLGLAGRVFEECIELVGSPYREILLGNLAIIHKTEGRHDEAIELYQRVLAEFMERGDVANAARVHHQIGNTYFVKRDFPRARESYRAGMDLARQIGDPGVLLLAKVQMANVQFASGEMGAALESYREALAGAEEIGNRVMVTAIHLQIAQIHVDRDEYAQAGDALRTAEALAREQEDRKSMLKIEQLHGLMARTARDYDGAAARFRAAGRHAAALGDPVEQANCHVHVGVAEQERSRFADAVAAYERACEILESIPGSQLGERDRGTLAANIEGVRARIDGIAESVGHEAFERIVASLRRTRRAGESE